MNYNPTTGRPTYNLALTYYKMGKMPEAEEYFLQAIRINPNKSDEYFYLGMTRFKSGRTPEAIACHAAGHRHSPQRVMLIILRWE